MQINFPSFWEFLVLLGLAAPAFYLAWKLDAAEAQTKGLGELVQEQSKELSVLQPKNNIHF